MLFLHLLGNEGWNFCKTLRHSRFESQSFAEHRLLDHVDLDSPCSSLSSHTRIFGPDCFRCGIHGVSCVHLAIIYLNTTHVAKRTVGSRHDPVAGFSRAPNGYRRSALGVFGLCTCWRRLGVAAAGTMVAAVGQSKDQNLPRSLILYCSWIVVWPGIIGITLPKIKICAGNPR